MSERKQDSEREPDPRLIAYVGSYGTGVPIRGGGIDVYDVSWDGKTLTHLSRVDQPKLAGHLVYAPSFKALYCVDERKTDGRGPVEPPAGVYAFSVDQRDGALTPINWQRTPGPRPSYVTLSEPLAKLFTANHGDFDHVEHVLEAPDGTWTVQYLYDDSTVVQLGLSPDGSLSAIQDLKVLNGHGRDPNTSPQAAGHGQASAHAHCAVIDPSGKYLIVCDKATDLVYVFQIGSKLSLTNAHQLPEQTGPRHAAFDPVTGRMYVTLEFSTELASFDFNHSNGELRLIDRITTLGARYKGPNEPAEVRSHPHGGFVYVNNRGEDSVAWFRVASDGQLTRLGHVSINKSIHPGLAARSFAFAPSAEFMLVADRPANLIRSYAVNGADGSLRPLGETSLLNPAYVTFAELPASSTNVK